MSDKEPERFQDMPINAQRYLLAMYSIAGRDTKRAVHRHEIIAAIVEQGLMDMNQEELLEHRKKIVTVAKRMN